MYLDRLWLSLLALSLIIPAFSGCRQAPEDDKKDVFMWMGANHLLKDDPKLFDNLLAFAGRHQIIPYESGTNDPESLRNFLDKTKDAGIERTWIEIGPGREQVPIRPFVENAEARSKTIQRFRELARIYKSYYPDYARITIFDEAPLGAFKGGSSQGYMADFELFKEYAPRAFSYLYRAIKEEFSNAEVGIFLHHPHNASPEMAGSYSYIEEFMTKTDSLDAVPDFIFSDVYRGYFNRGYGVEATNRYITDVVSHTKQIAERYEVEAYQLGQVHTIKLGYTPSKRQIDTNIEAMLAGNPDGIGWYWPNYASTNYERTSGDGIGTPTGLDVSFNPFVPNSWGKIGPAGSLYGTSKDRFTYSYLRVLEATDNLQPEKRFDLWVYGYDFDHVEHSVWLRTTDSTKNDWKLIGHFNPQQDRDGYEKEAREEYIYSYDDRWHAVAFHGLSRSDFIYADGHIEVRVESSGKSDGSRLSAIYALPYYQTRHYETEDKITHLIEDHPRWIEVNSLSTHIRPIPIELNRDLVFTGSMIHADTASEAEQFRQWLDNNRSD